MSVVKHMTLGSLTGLSADLRDFFDAAKTGNKKILKKLFESGRISDVDTKNEEGQTPLFFACYGGHEDCVRLLLDKGANPNETTDKLQTPLHAACYTCNVKAVSALVERGGDFRFHDKDNRTGKDFALMNPDTKKRAHMTEYIVKTRMFAMTHSGRDVLLEHQSSSYMRKASDNAGSIPQLFRRISSKGGGKGEQIKASASLMSLGYGKVYGGERGGTISTIPMIAESMLKHDDYGTTFMNSAFFVMEGMMLGPTKVTVKRLHHDPPKGGVVDHLIRECENIAHLRHPNVLLLMATCATDNMEGLVLVFERIYFGSLYNYLHEKNQQPAPHAIIEAGLQLCEGLIYIHQNSFIHNYVSSHSLFLTSCNTLKIGNFEYMVPMTVGGKAARLSGITSNKYLNATYNWMPPEVMKGELATERSDIYSFCTVMWEMFTGYIPWAGHDAEQIQKQVGNQKMLKVNDSNIPAKFVDVLTYGLQPATSNRKMSLEQIRDILSLMPRGRSKSDKSDKSPAAQANNHCSMSDHGHSLYGSFCSGTSPKKMKSSAKKLKARIRKRKSLEEKHPLQLLRCNHQTQTYDDERLWLSYTSSHEPDERKVDENGNIRSWVSPYDRKPPTNHNERFLLSHQSDSLSTADMAGDRIQQAAEERIQLCLALKAPIHEELKACYGDFKRRMDAKAMADAEKVENLLSPEQLSLQKQLNSELREKFSFIEGKLSNQNLSGDETYKQVECIADNHSPVPATHSGDNRACLHDMPDIGKRPAYADSYCTNISRLTAESDKSSPRRGRRRASDKTRSMKCRSVSEISSEREVTGSPILKSALRKTPHSRSKKPSVNFLL